MTTQHLTILALQISIFLVVFGFGLKADARQALLLVRQPGLFARSLLSMFVAMPLIAVVVVTVFELRPAIEIALVALAIAPIPPLLPGKENKAGGHTAYAIGLMAVVALLAIFLVPLSAHVMGLYFHRPFAMSSLAIARIVLVMVILPLVLGMLVGKFLPAVSARIAKPVSLFAAVLLVLGALVVLVGAMPVVIKLFGSGSLLAMAAFVVAGLAVGHLLGGPLAADRTVLALSTASRHPAIALSIAKANFPNEPYLAASIVLYLIVVSLLAVPYVKWRRNRIQTVQE
ncbi:MAG: hypothetical protein ABWY34_10565 [Pseudoxanthomonas sp.]